MGSARVRSGATDPKPKAVGPADMLAAMAGLCGYSYLVAEVGSEAALNDALDGVRRRRWTGEPKVHDMVAQPVFGAGGLKAAPTKTAGAAAQKVELKLRSFATASYYWMMSMSSSSGKRDRPISKTRARLPNRVGTSPVSRPRGSPAPLALI